MPADIPPPEDLKSETELRREQARRDSLRNGATTFLRRTSPIDIRPLLSAQLVHAGEARTGRTTAGSAASQPLPDDPALHRAVLAYASDMALMATSMMPHGVNWMTPGMQSASLDHAIWLHEPVRADDWLLYVTDSPWAGHGRGMNRGRHL